jgi:hypothetical protein
VVPIKDLRTIRRVLSSRKVLRLLQDVDFGVSGFVEEEGALHANGCTSRVIFSFLRALI